MKIALHQNSNSFFEEWQSYCNQYNIPFKTVNCYDSNIINQLNDCDALLWHYNHASPKDQIFAKQFLFSLEQAGIAVFPNFNTAWHFDDKLGQKYLFESLNIPAVPSHSFYSELEAISWINDTQFPKVFKLRRGAGARNVKLIETKSEAEKIIKKAFKKGFRQYDAISGIKETIRKYKLGNANLIDVLKAFVHLYYPIKLEKAIGREMGYVYFQDFIPNNKFDIRVIVIGNNAFAIKRNVRKNDFRASGSGLIEYDKSNFSDSIIKLSFENAFKLKTQCVAFDYVFSDEKPLMVEISYGFSKKGYTDCPGYWSSDLKWHEGAFNPYGWMIDNILKDINEKGK